MPDPDELSASGVHGSYSAWVASRPPAGEVFADPGDASPADVMKTIWKPTQEEQKALHDGLATDVRRIKSLFSRSSDGAVDHYAAQMTEAVGEFLLGIGVDPATLETRDRMGPRGQR